MSTVRVEKNKNYTTINNTVLNDTRLTWKAKGLAAFLLSKPDDWKIVREHLIKQADDGETAVRSALQELEECGYLTRTRHQNEEGKFEWEQVLHESPLHNRPKKKKPSEAKPSVENPPVVNPPVENHGLLSIESPSTDVLSTEKREIVPDKQAPTLPPSEKKGKAKKERHPNAAPIFHAYVQVATEFEGPHKILYPATWECADELARMGYTAEQVVAAYKKMKQDRYWKGMNLTLMSVAKQIGVMLKDNNYGSTTTRDPKWEQTFVGIDPDADIDYSDINF
jgi:hypothetical protein